MRGFIFFPLLFLVFGFVSGCSAVNSQDETPNLSGENSDGPPDEKLPEHKVVVDGEEQISPHDQEQWDLYDNENYSREDYETAFLNFVACVEDNDGWIYYSSLDDEVIRGVTKDGSDPDDYCYHTHFAMIDVDWQGKHPQDRSEEIQYYIDCLEEHNIEPVHKEPATEPGPQQDEQALDLWEQQEEAEIECEYVDPFYDDIPYPE